MFLASYLESQIACQLNIEKPFGHLRDEKLYL